MCNITRVSLRSVDHHGAGSINTNCLLYASYRSDNLAVAATGTCQLLWTLDNIPHSSSQQQHEEY